MNRVEHTIQGIKSRLKVTSDSQTAAILRPGYDLLLNALYGRKGLVRIVNGFELIRVRPSYRNVSENYEPAVFEYLRQRLSRAGDVLDIGAHMGIFSIVAARWMQSGGRVFAFEPTPITRCALEDHLRLNGVEDRITIVPMAVSDLAGAATFYTVSNSQENTLAGSHSRIPTAVPITVPVTTIDEFCAKNGATPALIKMDIEGFEIHALRGARETLLRYRPAVVVELHPMNWPEVGVQPEDLETLLREVGYRALALEHQRDLFGEYGHAALEP